MTTVDLIWSKVCALLAASLRPGSLLLWLLLVPTLASAQQAVTVGVLAPRGEARALAQWGSLMEQLSARVEGHRFQVRALDLDGLAAAVAAGEVDFVLTNPGQFVLLGTLHELSWLATLRSAQTGSTREAIGSVLLVRADSGLQHPRELRGRPVAAVHPHAFGGYLLAYPRLLEYGLAPESAFDLRFLGFPLDALLYELRDGVVDAAIVPVCLLEEMAAEGLLQPERFRALLPMATAAGCLSSTPLYPNWSFAALPHVPDRLASAVSRALLTEPEAGQPRWGAPISPAQVELLFRELRVHPLERPLWQQARDLIWHYWHYSLLALAALLAGFLHHLWIQALVLRRSRELDAAHLRLREREQQLAAAQRQALLGELASGLAHELNQPLAAIRHYAEGCAVRLRQQDAEHPLLSVLARIDQEAARGAAVVQRARGWLRREPPERSRLPLRELIGELLRLYEPQLTRRGVDVELEVPAALEAVGDRIATEQVLGNLIGNSLQAYQASGRRGPIHIAAAADADWVTIEVRDAAGGFSAERLREPFAPFRTTRPDGLGLGLVICQRLMQAQGGSLTLSNSEHGARVCLRLPRRMKP